MTIPELIKLVLGSIRQHFYADRDRDYFRDEQFLLKAISRYGYECNNRGWDMRPEEILQALLKLLLEIRVSGAQIKYLPTYLEGAVGRHLGQRAEEYAAKAKARKTSASLVKVVQVKVDGLQKVEAIREKSGTETLADVYMALRKERRAKVSSRQAARADQVKPKAADRPAPAPSKPISPKQPTLF